MNGQESVLNEEWWWTTQTAKSPITMTWNSQISSSSLRFHSNHRLMLSQMCDYRMEAWIDLPFHALLPSFRFMLSRIGWVRHDSWSSQADNNLRKGPTIFFGLENYQPAHAAFLCVVFRQDVEAVARFEELSSALNTRDSISISPPPHLIVNWWLLINEMK